MAIPPGSNAGYSLAPYLARLGHIEPAPVMGQVVRVVGLLIESAGPAASVGEICEVRTGRGPALPVEVVGFRDGRLLSVPLGETTGIRPGDRIVSTGSALTIPVGDALLGRVIDGLGRPLDGLDAPVVEPSCAAQADGAQSARARSDQRAALDGRARD
jgi:flagellar biosynthesis/type III secretory pathway ATPase